jgi:hypothetical protein
VLEVLDSNSRSVPANSDSNPSPAAKSAPSSDVSKSPNPYLNLGLSETQLGLDEILCDTKSKPKPAFQAENADSPASKKNVHKMGHSKPDADPHVDHIEDELKALHAGHNPKDDIGGLELSDLQLRAIDLTLKGHTDVDVSRILHINRRTLWRWKTCCDEYRSYMEKCRSERFISMALRYQGVLNHAAVVLNGLLDDSDQTTRLRAAQALSRMFGTIRPRK